MIIIIIIIHCTHYLPSYWLRAATANFGNLQIGYLLVDN